MQRARNALPNGSCRSSRPTSTISQRTRTFSPSPRSKSQGATREALSPPETGEERLSREHRRALLYAHGDLLAEPGLETHAALVQQHAEAVYAAVAARAGDGEQGRFERHVDDVVDGGVGWQVREIDVERRLARHAERRGVDQQGRVCKHG